MMEGTHFDTPLQISSTTHDPKGQGREDDASERCARLTPLLRMVVLYVGASSIEAVVIKTPQKLEHSRTLSSGSDIVTDGFSLDFPSPPLSLSLSSTPNSSLPPHMLPRQ